MIALGIAGIAIGWLALTTLFAMFIGALIRFGMGTDTELDRIPNHMTGRTPLPAARATIEDGAVVTRIHPGRLRLVQGGIGEVGEVADQVWPGDGPVAA